MPLVDFTARPTSRWAVWAGQGWLKRTDMWVTLGFRVGERAGGGIPQVEPCRVHRSRAHGPCCRCRTDRDDIYVRHVVSGDDPVLVEQRFVDQQRRSWCSRRPRRARAGRARPAAGPIEAVGDDDGCRVDRSSPCCFGVRRDLPDPNGRPSVGSRGCDPPKRRVGLSGCPLPVRTPLAAPIARAPTRRRAARRAWTR